MMQRVITLIPHFNNIDGLMRSITSIDRDDPCDVLVVDDGSVEAPDAAALQAALPCDGRVEVLVQPENRGIEAALNRGLDHIGAGHEFVARIDCGDRNVGRRFAKQTARFDEEPALVLLGGAARFVDPQGKELFIRQMPTGAQEIARFMRLNSAFMHPAVMIRTAALAQVGRYPTDYPAAEDYEFFWRLMGAGEVANLADVVIEYEVDPGAISTTRRSQQLRSRLAIQRAHADGSRLARYGMLRTWLLLRAPVSVVGVAKRVRWRDPGEE
jgi:glycosyltransferase involved in cell wall biosynthesis